MQPSSGLDDFGDFSPPPPQSGTGGSVALFLSLYLLLLAFFILLVAISQGENTKTKDILDGLNSQFAASKVVDHPQSFSSDLGNFVSPPEFFDNTAKVYEAAIPAAQVKVIKRGEIMEVSFHVGAMFEFGTNTLRQAQRRAIGQLVASLSRPPPGLRYQVEILFGFRPETGAGISTGTRDGVTYPVQESDTMRKAGVIARAFVEQGAPPRVVAVAMSPAKDDKRLRMIYRVFDEADLQADLQTEEPDDQGAPQIQDQAAETPAEPEGPPSLEAPQSQVGQP